MTLVPANVGGLDLLVEAISLPGSEPVSRGGQAERVQDLFNRAQAVIEQIAISTAQIRDRVAARAVMPDKIEIEFGLKFSVQGQIIVASTATEASLAVRISYEASSGSEASAQ
jgi:Trypsin-co-occurring domain 1